MKTNNFRTISRREGLFFFTTLAFIFINCAGFGQSKLIPQIYAQDRHSLSRDPFRAVKAADHTPNESKTQWTTNPFDHKLFIENIGQFDTDLVYTDRVFYEAMIGNVRACFTSHGLIYRYEENPKEEINKAEGVEETQGRDSYEDPDIRKQARPIVHYVELQWEQCNTYATIEGSEVLNYYYVYPVGSSGSKKAQVFKKIIYRNLYPGIDVEYEFPKDKKGLKYTLIVHPGADISRVKLRYKDAKELQINKTGDLIIQTAMGDITDHSPVSYYQSGGNVNVSYIINGSDVSFSIDKTYDRSKVLVIDPWTTNPNFSQDYNRAYDVDYDNNGNVYVYGGGGLANNWNVYYQLVKLNSAGIIQWVFNATPFMMGNQYYGDFAVDKSSGTCYVVSGLGSALVGAGCVTASGSPQVLKVNTNGLLTNSLIANGKMNEMWRLQYSRCTNKMVIAGGGVPCVAGQAAMLDTNLNPITIVNVQGTTNPYHDFALLAIDPITSVCYMGTCMTAGVSDSTSSGTNNKLLSIPMPSLSPNNYMVPDGYRFIELANTQYNTHPSNIYKPNGVNGIAASPSWLYLYDGFTLKRFNKASGALISTVPINAPVYSASLPYYSGAIVINWGGLDVDACDNIYAGNQSSINVYNPSLSLSSTIALPDTIYDLVLGTNYKYLYACGAGFVSSIIPAANVVAITKTKTPATCSCNGTASASLTLCGSPASGLTYTWSNGQNTQGATGLCPGTYTVTISPGCQTQYIDTLKIFSPIGLTLTKTQTNATCYGGTGSISVNINGGVGPYTYNWSPVVGNGATASGLLAGIYTVTVRDANNCIIITTTTIVQPNPIVVTSSSTPTTCNGSNGSVTVTSVSGGIGGGISSYYSYNWAPVGGTNTSMSNLSSGNYTVTVTDGIGCTKTHVVNVAPSAGPTATFTQSPSGTICVGTSVNFTNTGSTGTYNWLVSPVNVSGSTVNFSYTFLSTGSYTISHTVTSGGCSKQETSTVSVINCTSGPSVTATGSSVCPGSCGTVTASVTGGTSPYTYSWSNGATTQNISPCPASTTTYTVTIRDTGGNTSTSTAVVTVNPAISVNTTATNLACNGATNGSSLANPANGTAPYTYSWSNNQTTQTATGLIPGNYTVIVTDNKGCTAASTTTLTEPIAITASTTPTAAACGVSNGGATVSAGGGTGALTYSWSTTATGQTISAVAAGTYTVTVRDGNNCTKTAIAVISNFPSPAINSLTGNNLQCSGGNNGTAIVAASGGTGTLTYNWSNASSGVTSITGLTAGTYVVSVRDASGCLVVSTVSITEPSAITATTNGVNANCGNSNGSVSVVAGGGTGTLIYNWSNSSTGQLVTGLGAGIYTLTITDANSCMKTATATVNNINGATVTTTVQANVTCNGGTNGSALANPVGGTTPYTYSWSNGQTAPTATGLGAGSYTITITDASGCSSIANAVIISPPALTGEFAKGTSNCSDCGCKEWLMVTASGGTSPYNYSWPTQAGYDKRYLNKLCPGNYTVNITDKNGCNINVNLSAP